jgi:hypothetical protein
MAGPQIIAERGLRKNEIAMRRTAPMTAGSLEDLTDFIRQALTKCKETGMEPRSSCAQQAFAGAPVRESRQGAGMFAPLGPQSTCRFHLA